MKDNNKKKGKNYIVAAVILLLLVGITIGYAGLSTGLNIKGHTSINSADWDIHFKNVNVTSGSVSATSAATIDSINPLKVDYTVALAKPGDFYEFTVDVVNDGTLDARLADATKDALSSEVDVYANYIVTYADGNTISVGDTLAANGGIATVKVRIEYDDTIEASQLPDTTQSGVELNFAMTYVQK